MTTATDVIALETDHLLQVYRRGRVVFERGRGCRLFDADGRAYLDLISGVGVASLGHANPRLAEAISAQARELLHTSNLYFHPLQGELATRLSALSGLPRSFFCNSGAEAVEACLKFARKFWHAQEGAHARSGFVALEHSFHGRTMGSLSVTWDDHYRAPFAPLVPDVQFVPMDDPEGAQSARFPTATAAVIVEPLQGEGGVRPLSRAMADAITAACRETGALLIADEVQCGLGRTGVPFYSSVLGLTPDLMALGKALGAGVPIGAALFTRSRRGGRCARRPRQHLRRQPAGVPRRAGVSRGADRSRSRWGTSRRSAAHLEKGLRAIAATASGRSRGPRRRADVGSRPRSSGPAGRRRGAPAWAARQPHGGHGRPTAAAVRHHARRD